MPNYDFKKQPALLLQGAMDTETEYLIGQLGEPEEITYGNWKFYTGFLGSTRSRSLSRAPIRGW